MTIATKKLAELASIFYGASPASIRVENSDIPIFGTSGFVGYASKPLFETEAIVVGRKGTLGNPIFTPDKFWAIDTTYAVIAKEKIDTKWLYYALVHHDLTRLNEATGVPSINRDRLHNVEITYFEYPEQCAIADILSTLDEAIAQSESLVRKYQSIKQGLMSDLLTRGVDENGELKPETQTKLQKSPFGAIPVEWEVVLMDKVAVRGSGHTPSKSHPEYWNGGIKWVSLADSNKLDKVFISDTDKKISELGIQNSSAVKHPAGTVIISRDAGIGKSAIITEEMAVSQHFIAWTCGKRLNNLFLYYWLQFRKRDFESIAFGSTIQTIGLQYFRDLKVVLPPLEEQKRIAEILLTAEKMINDEAAYLGKLNYLKQGLMQDLLSGQVRVSSLL